MTTASPIKHTNHRRRRTLSRAFSFSARPAAMAEGRDALRRPLGSMVLSEEEPSRHWSGYIRGIALLIGRETREFPSTTSKKNVKNAETFTPPRTTMAYWRTHPNSSWTLGKNWLPPYNSGVAELRHQFFLRNTGSSSSSPLRVEPSVPNCSGASGPRKYRACSG